MFILDAFLTFKIPLKNSKCGGEVIYGVDVQMNEAHEGAVHRSCITAFTIYSDGRACTWGGEKGAILNVKETVIWNCSFLLF